MRVREQIDTYWQRHQALPNDLAGLAAEPGFDTPTRDPESSAPYGFEVKDADSYRLRASFALDTGARRSSPWLPRASAWSHPAGRFCFDLDVHKPYAEQSK
jgi:hypothetical protein